MADDGTNTAHNLFGLDLISHDSGSEVRTLLVDGLGSVRTELLGALVETATTYEPYGQVLLQSGTNGTMAVAKNASRRNPLSIRLWYRQPANNPLERPMGM